MHLVIPVDEIGAGFASGAVAPFVVSPVCVPFIDALVVSKKRFLAEAYRLTRSADKPTEAVEGAIHATPLLKRWRRMVPASVQYHPHSVIR